MASQKNLDLLLSGKTLWNTWRRDHSELQAFEPDLHIADLHRADLRGIDFHGADLTEANLQEADLRGADLREADLRHADLRGANLSTATAANATKMSMPTSHQGALLPPISKIWAYCMRIPFL